MKGKMCLSKGKTLGSRSLGSGEEGCITLGLVEFKVSVAASRDGDDAATWGSGVHCVQKGSGYEFQLPGPSLTSVVALWEDTFFWVWPMHV
jgi:hypothetical protein